MDKRLLFIAPSAYTLGGIQTWLDYILPGLEKKGWNIKLGLVSGRFHDVGKYLEKHPFHNVVKFKPPLVFDKHNADELVKKLDEVFNRIS